MAVSAFKSSSRRTNHANLSPPPSSSSSFRTGRPLADASSAAAPRRSRSVSAFSRARDAEDFLNKRDNPLFWSNASPPDPEAAVSGGVSTAKPAPKRGGPVESGDRRGRSVARSGGVSGSVAGERRELGRSLSRVDTGRRNRSVSRNPVSRGRFVTSESETEQECSSAMKNMWGTNIEVDSDDQNKRASFRSESDVDGMVRSKGLKTWSSQHSASEPVRDSSSDSPRLDPKASSELGVQEKTIKAVCEQMKSSGRRDPLEGEGHGASSGIYETVRCEVRRAISEIQTDLEKAIGKSNASAIASANITDIPPDLVNPSAVELVLDIRREYAKKLEQSHERARRLRADLDVEEHRGLELSRILKEVLPDPQTPSVQKSRPVRKASMERRKMSKRLTEEAMAYFDECVSLSTFDSSDFSSQEDPPLTTRVTNTVSSLQASSTASASDSSNTYFKGKQDFVPHDKVANSGDDEKLTASTSYSEPNLDRNWKSPFSFARKPTETLNRQWDIQKYVKDSEKGAEGSDTNLNFVRSNDHNLAEYQTLAEAQSFAYDRTVMRSEIESGTLLLCGGSSSVSFSHFASFF